MAGQANYNVDQLQKTARVNPEQTRSHKTPTIIDKLRRRDQNNCGSIAESPSPCNEQFPVVKQTTPSRPIEA